jgi:hypothetical protein
MFVNPLKTKIDLDYILIQGVPRINAPHLRDKNQQINVEQSNSYCLL